MTVPVGIGVVVLAATVLTAWLFWDRIPAQVPLHTGADGQVTRWGEKSVGNVLLGPLMGGGGMLLAMVVMVLVNRFMKARPADGVVEGPKSLGSLVRSDATVSALAIGLNWACLGFLVTICTLEVPRWINGYDAASPVLLFGLAVLGILVLPYLACRRVRPLIERELRAVGVSMGPETEQELHAWRYVVVVDDPDAPLMVPVGVPRTNFTVNVAKPAGKILAVGFLALMAGLALFLLLTPVLFS